MKKEHREVMLHLQGLHCMISDLIDDRPVNYIDLPVHGNVGDLLIMKGTMNFFSRNKIRPSLMAGYYNYRPNWTKPGEVVVFHGGGNFGDLYLGPQQIRESTIDRLKNNRIIILPQSIHFQSSQNYKRSVDLLSKHQDLHIFVRDSASYELAKPMSKYVYLVPDMAHQLWPLRQDVSVGSGVLGFFRTDDEIGKQFVSESRTQTDWPQLVGADRTQRILLFFRVTKALHLLRVDKPFSMKAMMLWMQYADRLIAEAVDLFTSHERVITDRLHGHILACLLELPNTVSDNSYGKNSRYINSWTKESRLVSLVG
ncbi:polysaccharide pyruvyl transferase family protein [Cupriavidus sp. L7L]|uniref:polysaccharide pyruvyl transferase family protein n=1 Tax=Cupriavidus sp. L7L TaxID=2546443 RepID=UPI001054817E|nr:polysaccharide pyruvyl transferase family protein [Cupriavidus sp. L7L]TDF66160.1 exopolysaccharide biosynthesis protein [Cupriavidus sp. L7L]